MNSDLVSSHSSKNKDSSPRILSEIQSIAPSGFINGSGTNKRASNVTMI